MSTSSKLQAVTGAQAGPSHKSSINTASFPVGNENVNSSYANGYSAPGQKGHYHPGSPQQVASPGSGNSPAHSPVEQQQYAQSLMLQQAYLQQQQYMQALLHQQQQQRPRTQSNTSLQHAPQQHGYPSPYSHPSQQQQPPHFFPQNPYVANPSSPAHMLPPQNFGHPSFMHQPSYSPPQLPSHFIPPQQFRQNGSGTPPGNSPVNTQQQYFALPPPNAPFAMNGSGSRPSSPSGSIGASSNGSDSQVRSRAESQQKDGRWQQSPYAHSGSGAGSPSGSAASVRGRTSSDTSDPRRTLPRTHSHSPSPSLGSNLPSSSSTPSPSLAQERARTNSDRSAQSKEAGLAGRSASPADSDRATTPTGAQYPASSSSSVSSGRTTPTAAVNGSSGHAHSASTGSTLSVAQQVSFTHGIARKASPLSQTAASVRSMTPTQGSAVANGSGSTSGKAAAEEVDGGNESDSTASDKREPKGHKTTNSNASSAASSSASHATSASSTQKGHAPSNSIFKSKIRKALSLSELNGQGNESVSSLSTSGAWPSRINMSCLADHLF